jgi:hypothetical protein
MKTHIHSVKNLLLALALLVVPTACDSSKEKTVASKTGEATGKTASSAVITEDVDKTLQCEIVLSPALQAKGLRSGKFSIENADEGTRNRLAIYLIFNKNLEATLTAKIFDKNGLEMGRAKVDISEEAGEAGFHDFEFDKRTQIEPKSKITIE